jgi:hypothetical protein
MLVVRVLTLKLVLYLCTHCPHTLWRAAAAVLLLHTFGIGCCLSVYPC